jgi:hypothetical protein
MFDFTHKDRSSRAYVISAGFFLAGIAKHTARRLEPSWYRNATFAGALVTSRLQDQFNSPASGQVCWPVDVLHSQRIESIQLGIGSASHTPHVRSICRPLQASRRGLFASNFFFVSLQLCVGDALPTRS